MTVLQSLPSSILRTPFPLLQPLLRSYLPYRTGKSHFVSPLLQSVPASAQPPPMVPNTVPSSYTIIFAPAFRGVEPLVSTMVTRAFFRSVRLAGGSARAAITSRSASDGAMWSGRRVRFVRISSARMEMAISSGVTALIASPIGVWMDSSHSWERCSVSSRCVFNSFTRRREPIMPR